MLSAVRGRGPRPTAPDQLIRPHPAAWCLSRVTCQSLGATGTRPPSSFLVKWLDRLCPRRRVFLFLFLLFSSLSGLEGETKGREEGWAQRTVFSYNPWRSQSGHCQCRPPTAGVVGGTGFRVLRGIPGGGDSGGRVSVCGVPPGGAGTPRSGEGGPCLLRLSSSSAWAAPGLTCLKGAMKADSRLTLSAKERGTGNALLTSRFGKTQRFPVCLLLRVWTREAGRAFWFQPLHSGSGFYGISDSILSNSLPIQF